MRWLVPLLLILFAALVLESGLLAYAMYVLLGVLLVSRGLARGWIGGLRATRTCSRETAEIGDRAAVTVTIRNDGPLPVPWVLMEDQLPSDSLEKQFPRLKVKGRRVQIGMMPPRGSIELKYEVECLARGYYQLGPLVLENGDLFGLHRRYRVESEPVFLLVYPKVVPLSGYGLASRRPIGDVRLSHRLYEDPTRIAGVRPYEAGDPLNRVNWKATARSGALHCKVFEPSTLTGATVLLDFHDAGYHRQGEPFRSELAVLAAVALVNAVCEMGQQVGLATNARDAADRVKEEGWTGEAATRDEAREVGKMEDKSDRLRPMIVDTRRGVEQLHLVREVLARAELTDGMTFAGLVVEVASRLPRDATVIAVLPHVPIETAIALGNLRRVGFAITVVLVMLETEPLERGFGRLMAEGIRDIRHLKSEDQLPDLARGQIDRALPYTFA